MSRLSLAIAAALLVPTASVPLAASAGSFDATDLDQVVVTGTRTEVLVRDSLAPVEVIELDEIERSQARDLVGLLQGRAGIGFTNQGGPGKLTGFHLRGTEADHVLVLVDGVRVGSATAGLTAFQDLPLDQIERVEIVRGPRSSLYGSEAIGGVIQIFTRRGDAGLSRHFRIGGGSHDLREASAGFSHGGARGWIGADAAYRSTGGIDACRGSAALFQGCFADEPDRDGYRNRSLNLRGGLQLSPAFGVEGHFLDADAFNEFDGTVFGGNEADNLQRVLGGKATWTPSDATRVVLQLGRTADQSDNWFADAATGSRSFVSTFDTQRDSASLQGDFELGEAHLLTAGADWLRDEITSTTAYDVGSRDNTGVFVGYQGRFGAHRVQASLRNDDNQQFGNHATGNLGWGYGFGNGLRLTASAGTGFRAPSFNDLYFPFSGNPALRPEESQTVNLGLSRYADGWHWTLDAYETRIDDLVALDANWMPGNIEQARIRGAEATFATSLAGFDLSTRLSHTDPRNRTAGANEGNLLPRRSRNTARVDIDRAFGAFRVGATGFGASHRYDNAANSVRLSGYGTLDLRLEYAINPQWTLQARATNVFDRAYETIAWYNQPGREYGLSLRYRARD
jgi:vitamin B12 transporter